jgi:hypothetical protein
VAKKPAKSDRQAVIDQLRKKQKGDERRRGLAIVGVCALVAVLIVGAAAFKPIKDWWDTRQFKDKDLAAIGAPASTCQKITTKPAEGNQQHVPTGTPVDYQDAPPAFGKHWNEAGGPPRSRASSTPPTVRRSRRSCTTSSTATRSSGTTTPSQATAAR